MADLIFNYFNYFNFWLFHYQNGRGFHFRERDFHENGREEYLIPNLL
jgi:hypothetical protein